jgi:hypothetical protein
MGSAATWAWPRCAAPPGCLTQPRPRRECAALLEHARHAASTALLPLPAGHYLLEDAPLALRDALVACLQGWAAAGAAGGPQGLAHA